MAGAPGSLAGDIRDRRTSRRGIPDGCKQRTCGKRTPGRLNRARDRLCCSAELAARGALPVGTGATVFGVDRLIVGTSGSPGSLQALRYGEVLARAHDAVLVPVIAWELPGGDRGQRIGPSGELGQACRDLAVQRLRDALTAVWGGRAACARLRSWWCWSQWRR
jgi:hypothetical protein